MPDRFTVYDVFAVLIPGVVFGALLAVTLGLAYELDLASAMGTLGDGALVIAVLVFGYAVGELLQALGKLVTSTVRRRCTGGMPATPRSLLPSDDPHAIDIWTQEFKDAALAALQARYGTRPPGRADVTSYDHLKGMTLQAYKWVEGKDTLVSRHLAQQHQMRAFSVAFTLLAIVAFTGAAYGAWFSRTTPVAPLIFLGAVYGVLATLAWWRMVEKDRTFAKHVLCRFLELTEEERDAAVSSPFRALADNTLTIEVAPVAIRGKPQEAVTLALHKTDGPVVKASPVHANGAMP